MRTLTVAAQYCGPRTSANGGYFAGLTAAQAPHGLAVRLLRPPPLDTEMTVLDLPDGKLEVRLGELLIAEAAPAKLELTVPDPPGYLEVIDASRSGIGPAKIRMPSPRARWGPQTKQVGKRWAVNPE